MYDPATLKRSDLLDRSKEALPKDILTLFCEATLICDPVNITVRKHLSQIAQWKLSEDLGNLLSNLMFTDVTLVVGLQEYQAHKSILAARSPVFAAMFQHEMQEQRQNRVTISDLEPEVLSEILSFMYTGKVTNLDSMAHDLLAAADKYCLQDLKHMCIESLAVNLSVETLASTLVIADLHHADQLKKQAFEFLQICAGTVVETDGWKNLKATYPHLLKEAFRYFVQDESQISQSSMAERFLQYDSPKDFLNYNLAILRLLLR